MGKGGVPLGELDGPNTCDPSRSLWSRLAHGIFKQRYFPIISLYTQRMTDSSLFKVKTNPLNIFISSSCYFFIPLGLL